MKLRDTVLYKDYKGVITEINNEDKTVKIRWTHSNNNLWYSFNWFDTQCKIKSKRKHKIQLP